MHLYLIIFYFVLTPLGVPDYYTGLIAMADSKRTRSRKKRIRLLRIPEVKGKIVEGVEADASAIIILFQDKTALSFNFSPGLAVFPELADRKTGDWQTRKSWPLLRSKPALVK